MQLANKQLISELETKITTNVEEVFSILNKVFISNSDKEDLDDLILLKARQERVKKHGRKGTITYENSEITNNQIIDGTLDLIRKIDNDAANLYYFKNSIFKRIVIVCRDKNRISYMKNLFASRFYRQVDSPILDSDFILVEPEPKIDLIIYDNFPKETARTAVPTGLIEILNSNKTTPILFFGPDMLPDLHEKYSDQVYFSNSKFSIHSRIQEMLLFLKHEAATTANNQSDNK